MNRPRSVALAALLAAGLLGAGCTLPAAPCDLVIAGVADAPVGRLPPDAEILATAVDIDPTSWRASDPGVGGGAVELRLGQEAADRLAAYTAANVGGFLALALDGAVVSTPLINGPIEDGGITITGGADTDIVEALRPCLPIEIRPPV